VIRRNKHLELAVPLKHEPTQRRHPARPAPLSDVAECLTRGRNICLVLERYDTPGAGRVVCYDARGKGPSSFESLASDEERMSGIRM
jgi:hypothetical protein